MSYSERLRGLLDERLRAFEARNTETRAKARRLSEQVAAMAFGSRNTGEKLARMHQHLEGQDGQPYDENRVHIVRAVIPISGAGIVFTEVPELAPTLILPSAHITEGDDPREAIMLATRQQTGLHIGHLEHLARYDDAYGSRSYYKATPIGGHPGRGKLRTVILPGWESSERLGICDRVVVEMVNNSVRVSLHSRQDTQEEAPKNWSWRLAVLR
jgi:hypothetical protein